MIDKLLVCTDLDRTLLPNGPQSESPGSHRRFVSLAGRPEVSLVYVTGRHRSLVERAISQYRLPVPDYVVADVGTTIYQVGSGHDWQVQRDWRTEIAVDWDGMGREDIEKMLQGNTALRLQEHAKQADFKLSYYVPVYEDREKLAAEVEDQFRKHNVRARLVWSIDELVGIGLLDILPARASKYHALVALMKQQGFDNSNTVFCGDSGNDLEVLASSIPAVLVANSTPAVREEAIRLSDSAGHGDCLYIASGGFMGMNGNYSAGMLEGIAHFYPNVSDWLS